MAKGKLNTESVIIELLESVNRKGITELVSYLKDEGFFTSPASTRFHGLYKGGLADHSFRVYELMVDHKILLKLDTNCGAGQKPLPLKPENIIIAGLLHDVCKVGAYLPNPGGKTPYKYNKAQPKGHALLSIERVKEFITLEPIEELMIKFHMGPYGCNEFYAEDDWQTGEYPIRSDHSECEDMTKEESKEFRYGKSLANAYYHNPIVKLIYFCDELATMEEKLKS